MEASARPDTTAPLFTVDRQTHDRIYTEDGTMAGQVTVYFTTRSGVQSSAVFTGAEYTADNVRAVLTEKANEIEAVQNLTPSTPGK